MHILDLPSDCHREIFKHLSLNDLIRFRATCGQLYNLIHSDVFEKKQALRLFVSLREMYRYYCSVAKLSIQDHEHFSFDSNNSLILDSCGNQETHSLDEAAFLAVLFPNVKTLVLSYTVDCFGFGLVGSEVRIFFYKNTLTIYFQQGY